MNLFTEASCSTDRPARTATAPEGAGPAAVAATGAGLSSLCLHADMIWLRLLLEALVTDICSSMIDNPEINLNPE